MSHTVHTASQPAAAAVPGEPHTVIEDIAALGPELDEGQLLAVTGGQGKDGGSDGTGGPCGACH